MAILSWENAGEGALGLKKIEYIGRIFWIGEVFFELERLIFFLIETNIKIRPKKAYLVQKLY